MKILKNKQDWRSVFFTVICLALLLIPFWLNLPAAYITIWLIVSSLFCFNVCIINHNHVHTAIFNHSKLNSLFGILLTLAKGHTSAGVILAHNYNHHIHNGNKNDWIRPQLAGEGPGVLRLLKFIIKSIITMTRGKRRAANNILSKHVIQQLHLERKILLLYIVILLYVDLTSFLIFVAIPWIMGIILLIGVNLLQHDQCSPDTQYNHSRNFTGKMSNWFFFNNGFHTAHHREPGLHWSQLPALHKKEITAHIDKKLEKNSIVSFLIKHYLIAW